MTFEAENPLFLEEVIQFHNEMLRILDMPGIK